MSFLPLPRWRELSDARTSASKIWSLGSLDRRNENPLEHVVENQTAIKSLRRIVVPLDGSPFAEHAIPTAVKIASLAKASLKIVYTYSRSDLIDPSRWHYVAEEFQKREVEIRRYVKRVADWASRNIQVPVETILVESPDKNAALLSATASSDLVVMASQPPGLISRFWSRSAIDVLRQRNEVPLLLVPGERTPPALLENRSLRRILVALDGSVHTECILRPVTMLARLGQFSVVLLHVQKERPQSAFDDNNRLDQFESVVSRHAALAPFVEKQVVITDRWVTDAIATYANQFEIDLIALATRPDRGVARLFRGSVVDGLIHRVRVPILAQAFDPKN